MRKSDSTARGECVVIGAGVVGLAVAASLAQRGFDVIILEREYAFGTVTSARNSEVIHAGIYYQPGSLKAQFCLQGKHRLYEYLGKRHVNHQQCGKLIVATSQAQLERLEAIKINASANGVDDLRLLTSAQAQAMEPALRCTGALQSPSTGIVDSHGYMLSLLGDAENHGATLVCKATVRTITFDAVKHLYTLHIDNDGPTTLQVPYVINAAGHGACALAASLTQLPAIEQPEAEYLKGNYFRLDGSAPFRQLVYPVPEEGGLGVHLTLDLAGMARFGPDVEPVACEDYSVAAQRADGFYAAVRRYWPALPDGALQPDYAGIRPRIRFSGQTQADFSIRTPQDHGLPGLINLFGIESPGLTASLAIAEYVADALSRE